MCVSIGTETTIVDRVSPSIKKDIITVLNWIFSEKKETSLFLQ